MKKYTKAKKRKPYFRALKSILRFIIKKPDFVFLGDKIENGSIILSNHEGSSGPLTFELYMDAPLRMWGTYEMNSGIKSAYKYLSTIYYPQKKHWNKTLAKIFCVIAAPLTTLFYSGFELISTYKDNRLLKTIKESIHSIKQGDNIVIFPEDSSRGYFKEITTFFPGFVLLCEQLAKTGVDVPIYVSYFQRESKKFIFDKPVLFSELAKLGETREQLAERLRLRCNELGLIKA